MSEHNIRAAYEQYDSDPRVSGVDDWEAFRDAVEAFLDLRRTAIIAAVKRFASCRSAADERCHNLRTCSVEECDELRKLENDARTDVERLLGVVP